MIYYVTKILKYLICVGISMIGILLFILIFGGRKEFLQVDVKDDIPLYLGSGWLVYQFLINKIHEQGLNYYWMIVKVGAQATGIILLAFIIMKSIVK